MRAESLAVLQPVIHASPLTPLRVSMITETYPPEINGVAMTAGRFVAGLVALGHQVQLIRPRQEQDHNRSDSEYELLTVKGIPIPFYQHLQLGLPAKQKLIRAWQQFRPDVVHIVTEGPLGSSAIKAAQALGIPIVSAFHTNFHQYSSHYGLGFLHHGVAAYLRRFHNRCYSTLVPTEPLAEELNRLGIDNAQVLSRGIDCQRFSPDHRDRVLRQSLGANDDQHIALYVGRIAAEKNLTTVIQAFASMQRILGHARLVFVGDGPLLPRLQRQHPEFVFCGVKTGADLAAYFASADIFLFPSLTETFGNVVLEAMASGLAVLAFDYAAARQHIQHEHSGVLVPYENNQVYIQAAQELARRPEKISLLRQKARAAVLPYDWNQIYGQLIAHYSNAVESAQGAKV